MALVRFVVVGRDAVAKKGAREDGADVAAVGRSLVHDLIRDVESVHVQQEVSHSQVDVSDLPHLFHCTDSRTSSNCNRESTWVVYALAETLVHLAHCVKKVTLLTGMFGESNFGE